MGPDRLIGAARRRAIDIFRGVQYWIFRSGVLQQNAMFESFQGKIIGDNPLYIYNALRSQNSKLVCLWTTRKGISVAPESSEGIEHGSREWLRSLATSKYLVNNTNFPWYFRKRKDQRYLQTWHGTPLKKLMREIEESIPNPGYLKTLEREARTWDFLISPNPYCSNVLPRVFSYGGPLLETGYPRNDVLVRSDHKTRALVRNNLGISDPETKVVLYAPTWRDYERLADGRWAAISFLDKDFVMSGNARLLYRGHSNTHDADKIELPPGSIDVTKYPNVTELCLAADVLVTDYSSIMFDFTITGKPLVIYAPDISTYVLERGLYFDLRIHVPGPVVETQIALVDVLDNIDKLSVQYSALYRRWSEKFHTWESGSSAQKIVEIFFE